MNTQEGLSIDRGLGFMRVTGYRWGCVGYIYIHKSHSQKIVIVG